MKRILSLLGFLFIISTHSFAQFTQTEPNSLSLPQVSALPGCAVADYGKMVFLTTTNRANVCSGSGWVEVVAGGGGGGSLTLPFNAVGSYSAAGFSVMNSSGGLNSAGIQGMTFSALNGANGLLGNAFETAPSGNNAAVRGINASTNANGYGVAGTHAGTGYGVYGFSSAGAGIYGQSGGTAAGVNGFSNQTGGVATYGYSTAASGYGIWGRSSNASGAGGYFSHDAPATGLALLTNGKLRFQGNGAAANKVLVSQDANGNANWEALTRTEILKLGPAAFYSHISSNESTMGSQGISMTSAAGSFHANVSLPNGATITLVRIYYIDNEGVAPSTGLGLTSWGLQKILHSNNFTYSNIVNGVFINHTAHLSMQSTSQLLTVPEVVNNATTFYRMVVTMPASTNLILVGVEISYTYTVNN
jgi:hypothetical protein